MICEYDNLYYLCVIVRWRNWFDSKLNNGLCRDMVINRFDSCPDYKDINGVYSHLGNYVMVKILMMSLYSQVAELERRYSIRRRGERNSYRFESCPDYICITDWWSDLYGPNYLWGLNSPTFIL